MAKKVRAVICNNSKYLAAEIGCGQYTGLWEFIGDYIRGEDTTEQTLVRCAEENLGIKIKVADLLVSHENDFSEINEFYLCDVISGELTFKSFAIKSAKWISKDELDNIFWTSDNKIAVDALMNR